MSGTIQFFQMMNNPKMPIPEPKFRCEWCGKEILSTKAVLVPRVILGEIKGTELVCRTCLGE